MLFQKLRLSGFGCWVNGNYHGIFGYSDDNLLLSPSLHGLQQMLSICEEFAIEHNLRFSTDSNPSKCKTKCIAFSTKRTILPELILCGNPLPWVDQIKHLGTTLSNNGCLTDQDVRIKRAQFINKNMELRQEFHFASARTLFELNEIYNSHFSGSPLWDLHGSIVKSLEGSYNLAVKNMFGLPLATHRSLICPITERSHLRNILYLRFVNFVKQIKTTQKRIPKMLLSHIMDDVNSTTGSNIRKILLMTDKFRVDDLRKCDIMRIPYHSTDNYSDWKVKMLKEIIDIKEGYLDIQNFDTTYLNEIIEYLCVS